MERVRNEEVHRRAGIEMDSASREDQRILRWFGHVERMDGQKGVEWMAVWMGKNGWKEWMAVWPEGC